MKEDGQYVIYAKGKAVAMAGFEVGVEVASGWVASPTRLVYQRYPAWPKRIHTTGAKVNNANDEKRPRVFAITGVY